MADIFYAQMNGEAIGAVQSSSGYKEERVDEDVEDNFEVRDHCSFAGLILPDIDGVDNISSLRNSRSSLESTSKMSQSPSQLYPMGIIIIISY
jgi:hypothetical protein